MRKLYFIKFSFYSVLIGISVIFYLHFNNLLDIIGQFQKILISLLILAIAGGLYGSHIAE